ncbi:hypothetical protein IQ07DRAFT_199429 [Pyrenochaeta sp. DS3sAY3a]|nr:hypothetical protein IQ07DRAFT_199429 [Pyrenochaeta sp. DS3sAY3a]
MPASNFRDYYEDLELLFGASQAEIKYAFSKLKMRYHPKNNNPGTSDAVKYRRVGEAFTRLSDPYSKPDYDKGYHFFKEEADRASIEVGEAGGTRTEQFDADEPLPRPSPPPVKPHREGDEDGWIYRGEEYRASQAYKEWEKKAEEYLARHPER